MVIVAVWWRHPEPPWSGIAVGGDFAADMLPAEPPGGAYLAWILIAARLVLVAGRRAGIEQG